MRLTLRYSEAALDDWAEAVGFYRGVRLELARALDAEVKRIANIVRRNPMIGASYLHSTRRKLLARFPYSFVYSVEADDLVLVIAIAHHSREPGYWADRLNEGGLN
ncbi:MAG TPA: type II toxin-antitoxin system RelE/ParE family toxin [Longimicrobium sp.]